MIRLKDRNSPGLIPGMPEAKSTGHKGLISSSSNSESTDSCGHLCRAKAGKMIQQGPKQTPNQNIIRGKHSRLKQGC